MTLDIILSAANDTSSYQQQNQEAIDRMQICPPVSGNKRRLVMPSLGDFSIRLRLPHEFLENFHIHVNHISLRLYQTFLITRKFVVMSDDGAFFTSVNHRVLTTTDLPRNSFLPMPVVIGQWDVLKILDLVTCHAKEFDVMANRFIGARTWELVLVRWRNGKTSWIPIEMISSSPFCTDVLQAFYMNTVNSWGFKDRIFPQNITRHQTEVELWRNHVEFQALFVESPQHVESNAQQLQERNQVHLMHRSNELQLPISPPAVALSIVTPSEQLAQQDVKVNFDIPPLEPPNVELTQTPVSPPHASSLSPNEHQSINISNQIQIEVPSDSTSFVLDQRASSEPSNFRLDSTRSVLPETENSPQTRKKKRRLRQYQEADSPLVDDEDQEDDELLNLISQPIHINSFPASTSSRRQEVVLLDVNGSDKSDEELRAENCSTRRKRLIQSQTSILSSDSEDDDLPLSTLTQQQPQALAPSRRTVIDDKVSNTHTTVQQNEVNVAAILLDELDEENKKSSSSSSSAVEMEMREEEAFSFDPNNFIPPAVSKYLDRDDEVDSKENKKKTKNGIFDSTHYLLSLATQTTTITERIACVCGATAIGRYTGTWLQCWHLECGRWQHAECVGYFGHVEKPSKYRCSICDPLGYKKQKKIQWKEETQKDNTIVWMHMFECIETHNSRCLLKLFHQSRPFFPKSHFINVNLLYKSTLMMKISEHGLVGCLHYLLEEIKAFVFVYDALDRNAMHYAVLGDRGTFSLRCMELLEAFGHDKLLLHRDRHGQTPFHLLLQQSSPEFLPFAERQLSRIDLKQADTINKWLAIHFLCTRPLEPLLSCSIEASATTVVEEEEIENYPIISSLLRLFRHFLDFSPMVLRNKSIKGHTPLMLLLRHQKSISYTATRRSQVVGLCLKILSVFNDFDPLGGMWLDRDMNGWMPWHHAVRSGNHALIDKLLQMRTCGPLELTQLMDPHALIFDGSKMSALHLAALYNFPKILKILLQETNLDVFLQDENGFIPLLYAKESVQCIRVFFQFQIVEQLQLIEYIEKNYFRLRECVKQLKQTIARDNLCLQLLNEEILKRKKTLSMRFFHFMKVEDRRSLLNLDTKLFFLQQEIIFVRATKSTKQSIPICKTNQTINKNGLIFFLLEQVDTYNKWYTPMEFIITKNHDKEKNDFFSSRNTNKMNDLIVFFLTSTSDTTTSTTSTTPSSSEWTKWIQLMQLKGKFCAHGLLFGCSIDLTKWIHWPMLQKFINKSSFTCQQEASDINTLVQRIGVQFFLDGFEQVLPGVLHLFHAEEFAVALQFTWMRPATKINFSIEWFKNQEIDKEEEEEMCLLVMDEKSNAKKKRAFNWFKRFLCVELTLLEQILLLRMLHYTNMNSMDDDALEPVIFLHEPNWIDLDVSYTTHDQSQRGKKTFVRSIVTTTTTKESKIILDFPRHVLLQEDVTYEEDFCPLLYQWLRHTNTAFLPC
jgi:ankyrin repeat protein